MSRSYKKQPVIKDNGGSKKFWKRYSNNKLKQHDVSSGGMYKKLVNPYFFCDYKWSLLGCGRNDWYYNCEHGGDYDEALRKLLRK